MEFSNVRFNPCLRYGPRLHRCKFAFRDLVSQPLAHPGNNLGVGGFVAMRQVEPGHVHVGLDHRL